MKEIIKAIIQKEAERRFPDDTTGKSKYDHTPEKKRTLMMAEYQWLIDALPSTALQGEDRWVSVEEQGNPKTSGFWWVQVEADNKEAGGLCEAYFTGKEWWDMDDITVKVLQYHPLPQLPKHK